MSDTKAKIGICSPSFLKSEYLVNSAKIAFENLKLPEDPNLNDSESLIEFLKDCEGAIISRQSINEDILDQLPGLKIISKYGVGLDNLDLGAMKERGVALGHTPGLNAVSVAEMVICFMIGIQRNIFKTSFELKNQVWNKSGGSELSGKTIGIIGFGNIGQKVAELLRPFNCNILVNDLIDYSEKCQALGYEFIGKDNLLSKSDLITLHVPYDPSTHYLISENKFDLMKSEAVLINTSRGNVVDENALFRALTSKKIKAAASDVFAEEPCLNSELLNLENFFGTPHIGGNSLEAVHSAGEAAINHLVNHFR